MNIKDKLPILIGLGLPVLMIIIIAGAVFLPGLFSDPTYDFLYATGNEYAPSINYGVRGGEVVELPLANVPKEVEENISQLYLHDVSENKSTPVTLEEANKFTVDEARISPDGYEIVPGSRSDGFFPFVFFSSRDYSTWYIKGGGSSERVNIIANDRYYRGFRFIGWIVE